MRHIVDEVPLGGSVFPPIAGYAFLSDCEVCALVAPSGAIEWMCLPRFDGPSIFGAILDRDAGRFTLTPAEATLVTNTPRSSFGRFSAFRIAGFSVLKMPIERSM